MNLQNTDPPAPDYAIAFKSVRTAKSLCLLAILLALLVQLASFYLVRIHGALDPVEIAKARSAAQANHMDLPPCPPLGFAPMTRPAAWKAATRPTTATTKPAASTQPVITPVKGAASVKAAAADKPVKRATTRPAAGGREAGRIRRKAPKADAADSGDDAFQNAVMWKQAIGWILRATKAVTPIICLVLVATLVLGLMLSLLGRLGGVSGLTGSLYWSLILLVLLCPWHQVFQDSVATGALYDLPELLVQTHQVEPVWKTDGADNVQTWPRMLYYVRFVALPIIALLVWLVVVIRFAVARRSMLLPARIEAAPGDTDDDAATGGDGDAI